jgi:hypothetical protein
LGDDLSALLAAAAQAGYAFTVDEYRAALTKGEGELTDGDLSSINGGTGDVNGTLTLGGTLISGNTTISGNSPANNQFAGGVAPR